MTSRTFTFTGYGLILMLTIVLTAIAAGRANWMTLPGAFGSLTRRRPVRILVVAAWIWLGWHLFARGSGAFE